MCLVDFVDDCGFIMLQNKMTKAIKQHRCTECRRIIEPGERYRREVGVGDGEFNTYKTCEHCLVARDWLMAECGGCIYGAIEEDIREHCHSGLYPISVYRLAIGMQWQWRAPSGRALPVPSRQETASLRPPKSRKPRG